MSANSTYIAGMVTKKMLCSKERIKKSACLCTPNSQMLLLDELDLITKMEFLHRKKKILLLTLLSMILREIQFLKIFSGMASIARVG